MFKTTLISIAGCFVALLHPPLGINEAAAQSNNEKPSPATLSTEITVRKDGWLIPVVFSKSRPVSTKVQVDGKNVSTQTLTPRNLIVDYEDYFVISNTEVAIERKKMRIVVADALSVNGKVFQYSIRYTPFRGKGSDVSSIMDVKYIDSDGDGIFEQRMRTPAKISLPDWVQALPDPPN